MEGFEFRATVCVLCVKVFLRIYVFFVHFKGFRKYMCTFCGGICVPRDCLCPLFQGVFENIYVFLYMCSSCVFRASESSVYFLWRDLRSARLSCDNRARRTHIFSKNQQVKKRLTLVKNTRLFAFRSTVCVPREKLLGIMRVSNPSTSIDPGSLKIGFLVLIQNAGFVRDNGTN